MMEIDVSHILKWKVLSLMKSNITAKLYNTTTEHFKQEVGSLSSGDESVGRFL